MRKGLLGSIAALAAGAGTVWAQAPMPIAPAGKSPASVVTANEPVGTPSGVIPASGGGPSPVIMPPISVGPPGDPHGVGPAGGFGPPPGPMYPTPGPYAAPRWQPATDGLGGSVGGGGFAPHYWWNAEYLLWFPKSQPMRFPLLTTSAPSDAGLLGRPSTLVLAGGDDLAFNATSGARFSWGFFGDANRRFGAEVTGFFMGEASNSNFFQTSPTGIPTLARPFIDSASPRNFTSLVLANPNFANAAVLIDTSTRTYSVEGNAVFNIFRTQPDCPVKWSLDFLFGYRYLELDEELTISSQSTLNIPATVTPQFVVGPFGTLTQVGTIVTPASVPFGGQTIPSPSLVSILDGYKTTNRFNGGQVGLRSELQYGMFTLAMTGKFAIGHMHETAELTGGSQFTALTGPARSGAAYGGLYNNASNIGKFSTDEFVIIPEFTGNIGVNITRSLNAYIGYNFLYVNRVIRPGSLVNPTVNSATVPFSPNYGAQNRPSVRPVFSQDDFWLMGINFGLQLRF